jgi:tetratricopeptide (TPR) repeat protein/transcriptional regulator with XRE-family HTH domain
MADQAVISFASLLKQLRLDARLTQEELAIRATISHRAVSDLERGVNLTARRDTARLLADALELDGARRIAFEAAARGDFSADGFRTAAGSPAAATRTLPRDVTGFTGRSVQLQELIAVAGGPQAAAEAGIWAIGGMAGVGKSTFAIHAAHQLAPQFPAGQIFLSLHGHAAGQQPVEPAEALASLLQTAGVAAQLIPPDLETRIRMWRDHVAGMRLLLVLDNAADTDQVRPLLPGTPGSLVLITSRRHLTALEDAHPISLDVLPADEAEDLFIRLAGRTGLERGDCPVAEITKLCGYLPLAIGMLARQLNHHPSWTSARLANELAAARDRLAFMRVENLSVAAAFGLSYQDLTPGQQRLFRRLGLHPGPDFDSYAAAALADIDVPTAARRLEALYDQHLLIEPGYGRYRMHDLIREHARSQAADDPVAESEQAIDRLLNLYQHAALTASNYLGRKSPGNSPATTDSPPAQLPDLPDRQRAVAWLDAERLSLHAAAGSAATGDRRRYAIVIAAAIHGFLRSHSHWDQALMLNRIALQAARDSGDRRAQAGALTDIGEIQQLTGDYPLASASLVQALELYRELADKLGLASALNELGVAQLGLNDHPAATASHEEALAYYRELGITAGEASALNELGLVQRATGDYQAATAAHEQALRIYRELGNRHGEASALNRLAQMLRSTGDYAEATALHEEALALHQELGNRIGEATSQYGLGIVHQATGQHQAAIELQRQALRLYRELGYRFGQATAFTGLGAAQIAAGDFEAATISYTAALRLHRDLKNLIGQVAALNGLGTTYLAAGDFRAAAASLDESLRICRDTGHRPGEADALHVLGQLQLAQHDQRAAASLARALDLYTELGVRNGAAEVLNTSGDLAFADADYPAARAQYQAAQAIATEISLRAELARALAGVGRCQLAEGQTAAGLDALRQAQSIYAEIGSATAAEITAILAPHSQ